MKAHLFPTIDKNRVSLRILLERIGRICVLLVFLSPLIEMPPLSAQAASSITFTGEELLARPEDTSITVNMALLRASIPTKQQPHQPLQANLAMLSSADSVRIRNTTTECNTRNQGISG
jgi:hypothetical protein